MTKKKVVVGLSLLAGVAGIVAYELKKKERLNRLEDALSGLVLRKSPCFAIRQRRMKIMKTD